jgi:hypothetical protein
MPPMSRKAICDNSTSVTPYANETRSLTSFGMTAMAAPLNTRATLSFRAQGEIYPVPSLRSVIPAHAGIQVTDSVRHTVEKRYPGGYWVWIPVCTGMTD